MNNDGGNHSDQYKRWCLAYWLITSLPGQLRRNGEKWMKRADDKKLRRWWLEKHEKRHGKDPDFRLLIVEINKEIMAGREPEYNGPFQPAQRGKHEA